MDDETRAEFEAAGLEPFVYAVKDGRKSVMSYYQAPEESLESPAVMAPWARKAYAAALRAAAAKKAPRGAAGEKAPRGTTRNKAPAKRR